MKKRLSFRANFGFGTFTSGMSYLTYNYLSIVNFRLPIADCSVSTAVAVSIGNWQSAMFLTYRDCRLPFRQIHQTNIPSLRLEIEITRAPVDIRQQESGN